MRSLLATLLSWLMPARGKRRRPAEGYENVVTVEAAPTRRLVITSDAVGVGRPATFIEADGLPLVRPYVIAHEREQERRRQRDRRTALTLATLGIDFHGVAA